MTPDRLRAWLGRQRVGAHMLRLVHARVDGETIIATWVLQEDLELEPMTQIILDAAQDFADGLGESVRCKIEILAADEETVLATHVHNVRPIEQPDIRTGDVAHTISPQTIVAALLQNVEKANHVIWNSHGSATKALERTVELLLKQIERQARQIDGLQAQLTAARDKTDSELAELEEEREAAAEKAEAWRKVGELAPTALQMGMQYVQSQINGKQPAAAEAPPPTNGVAS